MQVIDLFSGIGGFSLAAHWVGWETALFCEKDKFCQKVLAKNFPGVPIHDDIKTLTYEKYRKNISASPTEFILTGGFPCQPFSTAGKRKGTDDDRHLWPEMLRVIREFQPAWVVGENVAGILSMDSGAVFEKVCTDLESEGYAVQAFNIPAISKGAPHRRDRIWIVAHSNRANEGRASGGIQSQNGSEGLQQKQRMDFTCGASEVYEFTTNSSCPGTRLQNRNTKSSGQRRESGELARSQVVQSRNGEIDAEGFESCNRDITNSSSQGLEGYPQSRGGSVQGQDGTFQGRGTSRAFTENQQWGEHWYEVATRICRVDDGISRGVDKNRAKRLKALGNAIVPQVAFEIFKVIELHNHASSKTQKHKNPVI